MYRHRSVSLNNEKNCCEISEDKIVFCEKTAGLRSGNFSDLNPRYFSGVLCENTNWREFLSSAAFSIVYNG